MSTQTLPDVQKAWLVVRQGKPARSLKFSTDWPVPRVLKGNEVLVKVQAAALNPVGWKLMKMLPNFAARRPHVAEHDLSGVVVQSNDPRFSSGDQVFGWIPTTVTMKTRQGALAEYARVPADHLAIRPANVTPVQAAGLTLAGMTAYQALHGVARIEKDQSVLINGGSSAVGAFATQIAKAAGARVTAVASGRNEAFVRNQGADEFIDYKKVDLPKYLAEHPPSPKFHIIFDAVGLSDPTLYTSSEKYLAPNGIFVSTGPLPQDSTVSEVWNILRTFGALITPRWLGGTRRTYKLVLVENNVQYLDALRKLVADGAVKPIVDSVFDFQDALKAFDRIRTYRATGKVVVKVDPSVN